MEIGLVDWKGYFDKNIYIQDSKLYDINGELNQNVVDDMKFYIYRDFQEWITKFNLKKLIISFESGNWRKEYFKLYKFRRKLKRQSSGVEHWDFWKSFSKELEEEFKTLPIVVCHHPKLEADDINAILTKYYVNNGHNVTVFGNDEDYNQLFRYNLNENDNNITLYNTKKKMFVEPIDYKDMLYKAIIQGQRKDDIPSGLKKTLVKDDFRELVGSVYPEFLKVKKHKLVNVINENYDIIQPLVGKYTLDMGKGDVFELETTSIEYEINGKMKKLSFPKYVDLIKQMGFDKWLETLEDEIVVEQIKRNRVLMDFEFIPNEYRNDVIKYVQEYTFDGNTSYVYNISLLGFEKHRVMNTFKKLTVNDNNQNFEF